jgi:hypothetical protein
MFSLDAIGGLIESYLKKNGIDPAKVVKDIQGGLNELNQRLERIENKQFEILEAIRENNGDITPAGYGSAYEHLLASDFIDQEAERIANGGSSDNVGGSDASDTGNELARIGANSNGS